MIWFLPLELAMQNLHDKKIKQIHFITFNFALC
jgi:hypothetical protein